MNDSKKAKIESATVFIPAVCTFSFDLSSEFKKAASFRNFNQIVFQK